jgi:hypothetical protein
MCVCRMCYIYNLQIMYIVWFSLAALLHNSSHQRSEVRSNGAVLGWCATAPHHHRSPRACCHGPIAHTPGCVLHMLYYVVLNITWTYSSANDLTYHAVVLFPKRTWYSCCTNCTIDCGMSYVFTNTSCCIVLLLQWLPLMSLPLHHRLQHYRRTSASKVRCWVAVHVPEVCV